MSSHVALLPLIAPAALCLAAALARLEPGRRPRRVLGASRAATAAALVLAAVAGGVVAVHGPLVSPVLGAGGIGFSIRLDVLSAVMFGLVAFVGVIVVQYSRNYLHGDPRHGAFLGGLCLTLAAVLLLVLSGNLLQLVAAWIATSLTLQRLLLFYRERPSAIVAARKKFIVSRIGDACLIAAAILLVRSFGTADVGAILEQARAALGASEVPPGVRAAAVLLAVTALLKSAQFPTHGWLPEVMETPSPVSALLHAGIINAGGFLVIRLADVMLLSPASMYLLVIVGGFTALFGSAVMLTQTSVKVSLAWSTVAQMGFMLLECGLGVFSVALLHIVAHSLYKAHAFLSSGSVVETARASWIPISEAGRRLPRFAISLAMALAVFLGVGWLVGVSLTARPTVAALGAILVMGLTHLLAQALDGKPHWYVVGRTVIAAAGAALLYFVLETGAEHMSASTLPPPPYPDAIMSGLLALVVGAFGLAMVLQLLLSARASSRRWQAAYVHLRNGLYVNVLFSRLVGGPRGRDRLCSERS